MQNYWNNFCKTWCIVPLHPLFPTWQLEEAWTLLGVALRREVWADVDVSFKRSSNYESWSQTSASVPSEEHKLYGSEKLEVY